MDWTILAGAPRPGAKHRKISDGRFGLSRADRNPLCGVRTKKGKSCKHRLQRSQSRHNQQFDRTLVAVQQYLEKR